ncbi:helix-turn-helix transcriptional regulator [Aerococcus tenax]|uniref:Helix-turn-helix transcriptional regulator n=1 Tax=Aerococcus tenax TaxID=3078812 RepID=A0A5N1BNQ8_9LACT|nr:helix-turn-helix transcriptional regulator [Aerococcus urinae]KAA9239972.1 helix-turn-helix transcriptional regulator [Aerococcus urinae]MDK6689646.1 helix-turn-helix transcriptional regulator [Aerococcus urinae]
MNKIKSYRQAISYSQNKMAFELGLSINGYRQKESGETEFKKSEMLKFTKVINRFMPNITVQEIFFNQ